MENYLLPPSSKKKNKRASKDDDDDISLPSKKRHVSVGDISRDSDEEHGDFSSDEDKAKDSGASNELSPGNWIRYIESASSATSEKPPSRIQPVSPHPRSERNFKDDDDDDDDDDDGDDDDDDDDDFELDFSEFKDLASFKSVFLKDRECGEPISGFPEDLLEDYYRLCLLVKRLIHGKFYETHGAVMGDAFIKKMVWVFEKASIIFRMKVGVVTHEELDTVLVSVVFCEKSGLDLGVVGKSLRDVKSVKDTIDHMMVKYEEFTTPVVDYIEGQIAYRLDVVCRASSTSKKPPSRIQPVSPHPRSGGSFKDDDDNDMFELDFNEFKDYSSFKQIFLTDRESGSERTGWYTHEFPEDWLKDYYAICCFEKRFLHGKRYSILGKHLVDAFIKTIVEIYRTTRGLVKLEVSRWDYEELKRVKLLVLQCEKGGFALGLLGKLFSMSMEHKENIMQLEKKLERKWLCLQRLFSMVEQVR